MLRAVTAFSAGLDEWMTQLDELAHLKGGLLNQGVTIRAMYPLGVGDHAFIDRATVDAARIDGCGPLRFLTSVLIPMSWNTVGALAVIQFVYAWDQYLWPLVIMQQDEKQVVQVGLRKLIEVGGQTDWGAVMAGAIVTMLPPLIVFTLLQEQFSKGFALTEDK